jgi:hypothetical protein
MVTYHAPHTVYVTNIITPSRILIAEGIAAEYSRSPALPAIYFRFR